MLHEFKLTTFTKNIFETVVWCNFRLAESLDVDSLRSLPVKATLDIVELSLAEREQFITDVFEVRSRLLRAKSDLNTQRTVTSLTKGKLLAFFPDGALNDGVPQAASKGYFDNGGYPPWDTWIYYVGEVEDSRRGDSHILTWVPPYFLTQVTETISLNADDSLMWVSDEKFEFEYVNTLRRGKFLI